MMTNWTIYYFIAVICSSIANDFDRAGAQLAGENEYFSWMKEHYPNTYWMKSIASIGVFAFAIVAPFFAGTWWRPIALFITAFILSFFVVRPIVALLPFKNAITPMRIFGFISFAAGAAAWTFLFI